MKKNIELIFGEKDWEDMETYDPNEMICTKDILVLEREEQKNRNIVDVRHYIFIRRDTSYISVIAYTEEDMCKTNRMLVVPLEDFYAQFTKIKSVCSEKMLAKEVTKLAFEVYQAEENEYFRKLKGCNI